MDKENNKFYSLTPEKLNENKKIYTEALDFAFANNDIKNIAITGIYGAGKSTVWKTYEKERDLKNIISVTFVLYLQANVLYRLYSIMYLNLWSFEELFASL